MRRVNYLTLNLTPPNAWFEGVSLRPWCFYQDSDFFLLHNSYCIKDDSTNKKLYQHAEFYFLFSINNATLSQTIGLTDICQ